MAKYNSYPKYKNSNIPWLGEIPEHWRNWKVSRGVKSIGSGTTPSSGNKIYYENGTINWLNTGDFNDSILKKCKRKITELAIKENSALKIFPKGTLSIAMYGATIGKVCIVDFETTTNQACCNIVEGDVFDNKFLMYWFIGNKKHIVNLSYGGGQPNISQDVIKSLIVPSPEIQEQTAIARFLDYKLAKINRFIQKKKQLIKLLNEQKAAIINQAVTKGLDPNAKMKDSGIEWLGEIPEHWEVKPIKYFVTCNDESLTDKTDKDFQLRYIDIGNVDSNGKVSEIVAYKFKDAPSRARRIVKEGDIIVSTVRTYLKAIMHIKGDTENLIVSTGFAVLRPRNNVFSEFLNYAIRANYFIGKVVSESNGVSYPAINSTELITLKIAIPLIDEQKKIVQFIDSETEIINTTISKIEKELALTEEYKTALIAEAVTGKIDVRGYEVPEILEEERYEDSDSYREEEEMGMVAEDGEEYEIEETE